MCPECFRVVGYRDNRRRLHQFRVWLRTNSHGCMLGGAFQCDSGGAPAVKARLHSYGLENQDLIIVHCYVSLKALRSWCGRR